MFYNTYKSGLLVLLYRISRVYLLCDQSQTTPVVTAFGEPDMILHYVSYIHRNAMLPTIYRMDSTPSKTYVPYSDNGLVINIKMHVYSIL